MPNTYGNTWMQAAAGSASGAVALGLQRIGVGYDNRQQLKQQKRLSELQIENESKLMDIQNQKQYEQWVKTGPVGQKEQYKAAGLNPALMYGIGGGGGQSMGAGVPSVTTATAENPKTSQGAAQAVGMGLQGALLMAQIENIKADTANKTQGTAKTWQETHALEMQNIITQIAQSNDEYGNDTKGDIHKSAAVKQKLGEAIMQSKTISEIAQKTELMKAQGLTEADIQKKLEAETKLLQNEIDWQALDITGDNIGSTIQKILTMIIGVVFGVRGIESKGNKGSTTTREGYNAKGEHYFEQKHTKNN